MFVKCESVYVCISEKHPYSRFDIEEIDSKIYFIWKNQKQFGNETLNIKGIFFKSDQIYYEPFNIHINKQITEFDLKSINWKHSYSFEYQVTHNLFFDIETSSDKQLLKSKIIDNQLWIESGSKTTGSLPKIQKIKLYNLETLEWVEHNMNNQSPKKIIYEEKVKEVYVIDNIESVLKDNPKPIFALNIPDFFTHIYRLYPALEVEFMQECEPTLHNMSFDELHWAWHIFYCRDGNSFYRYILNKYKNNILSLDYEKVVYNKNKKNTLLFIDDRYDSTFIYILILFLFSIGKTVLSDSGKSSLTDWNITIFTSPSNSSLYEEILKKHGMTAKINHLKYKFKYPYNYSYLMCTQDFWKLIPEETVFIFQYDSTVFGKFREEFLKYNYIGALFICEIEKTRIGNGGTCIRKTRAMEGICASHKYKGEPEDVYFCKYLVEKNLHNCPIEVAERFAFEHIKNDYAAYGHQYHWRIPMNEWESYMINRWEELFGHPVIYNKSPIIEQKSNKMEELKNKNIQLKTKIQKKQKPESSNFDSVLFNGM